MGIVGKVMQEGDCGKKDVERDYGQSDAGRKGIVEKVMQEEDRGKRDAGREL